jgi:hypothetical protein
MFHTVSPILRSAILLTFVVPSIRRALLRHPNWRILHHMAQRLLPWVAALQGVLGVEVMSISLKHALRCWLDWWLPVFMGWMSFMLVVSPSPGA